MHNVNVQISHFLSTDAIVCFEEKTAMRFEILKCVLEMRFVLRFAFTRCVLPFGNCVLRFRNAFCVLYCVFRFIPDNHRRHYKNAKRISETQNALQKRTTHSISASAKHIPSKPKTQKVS